LRYAEQSTEHAGVHVPVERVVHPCARTAPRCGWIKKLKVRLPLSSQHHLLKPQQTVFAPLGLAPKHIRMPLYHGWLRCRQVALEGGMREASVNTGTHKARSGRAARKSAHSPVPALPCPCPLSQCTPHQQELVGPTAMSTQPIPGKVPRGWVIQRARRNISSRLCAVGVSGGLSRASPASQRGPCPALFLRVLPSFGGPAWRCQS